MVFCVLLKAPQSATVADTGGTFIVSAETMFERWAGSEETRFG